jgi:hypothetical protein
MLQLVRSSALILLNVRKNVRKNKSAVLLIAAEERAGVPWL